MAKRCDVCNKSFKNARGVEVHKMRIVACGGARAAAWGSGRKTTSRLKGRKGKGKGNGREVIRSILGNHPQGLTVDRIAEGLKERGFKLNPNYVSQSAASDPNVVRVTRGVYRLRKNRKSPNQTGATVVMEAVTEAQARTDLPREALLLRIETLEAQVRAVHDAHLSLLRGVIV